jgi:LL-diaminopimelate aminotransferase
VIDLGAGDADLAPPPAAVQRSGRAAGAAAIRFRVGPCAYREAIVARWSPVRQRFDPMTEVVPLLGSKEGLAHVAFAYRPATSPFPSRPTGVSRRHAGSDAEPFMYALRPRTDPRRLDEIPHDVLARTRMLYLNYPNNPTAAIASREYLERVVRTCRERDILLVYDNAYSEMGFDGYVPPSIFEIDGARDVAIEFHSLSKTYNMTGWRCGWAVAKPEIASALAKVKSFTDTGSMGIQAPAWLLAAGPSSSANLATFQLRQDAAVAAFRANGFEVEIPRATMYLWMPLPGNRQPGFC